jgi:hypothetical protein
MEDIVSAPGLGRPANSPILSEPPRSAIKLSTVEEFYWRNSIQATFPVFRVEAAMCAVEWGTFRLFLLVPQPCGSDTARETPSSLS